MLRKIHCALALLFCVTLTACGGGGGKASSSSSTGTPTGGGGTPVVVVDYAPDALPAGTTLTINPTLTLTSSTALDYSNSASDSAFTPTLLRASWAYTPYTAGNTTGTLTISGDGGTASAKHFSGPTGRTAALLNFIFSNHQIVGATATINGSTYNVTFGGATLAPGKGPSSSSSGATTKVIASKYEGTFALTYKAFAAGGDFKDGDKVSFVVANDTLSFNGKSLVGPVADAYGADPYDFADGGSGTTYRFSALGKDAFTLAPTVSVIKGGSLLGQFMQTASVTPPAGTVYGPLAGKVHHMVCVENDDPNTAQRIGNDAELTFYAASDGKLNFSLQYAGGLWGSQPEYLPQTGFLILNADGSIQPSEDTTPSFADPSVSVHNILTFTVDTTKRQCTELKSYTEYSRNGAVFRRATTRYQLTFTETP